MPDDKRVEFMRDLARHGGLRDVDARSETRGPRDIVTKTFNWNASAFNAWRLFIGT